MFQPRQIPPEVLEAMLGLSEQDEEKRLLDRQLMMGNMLGRSAIDYNGRATGVGGAASAIAQGLQGFGAGKLHSQYEQASQAGMATRRNQRRRFFDLLNQPPQQPNPHNLPRIGTEDDY